MKHKAVRVIFAVVPFLLATHTLLADELGELNRQDIDLNKGRIGSIESQVAANNQNIDLNTQMIGINGAAIVNLEQQLNDLSLLAVYNFKDYAVPTDVSEKVFRMKGPGCGDTEVRKYIRTPQTGSTLLTMVRIRSQAGIQCQYRTFDYIIDDQSRRLARQEKYNADGTTLKSTAFITDPIEVQHSSMRVGRSWGGGSEVTLSPEPVYGAVHAIMSKSTLLKVEDITVAYNGGTTFSGCLKIGATRTSDSIGQFMRVEWFCPDIGLVKRIQNSLTSPPVAIVWELNGVTR